MKLYVETMDAVLVEFDDEGRVKFESGERFVLTRINNSDSAGVPTSTQKATAITGRWRSTQRRPAS